MAVVVVVVLEVEDEEEQLFRRLLLLVCLVDRDRLPPVSVSYIALIWLANVMG